MPRGKSQKSLDLIDAARDILAEIQPASVRLSGNERLMGRGTVQKTRDVLAVAGEVGEVCRHDARRALRLSRWGLSGPLLWELLAVRGGDLVYQIQHKLARGGSKCAKLAVNVQQERGRAVWIEGRETVARGTGEPEGNQAETEAK